MTEVLLNSPIQVLFEKIDLIRSVSPYPWDTTDLWQLLSVVVNHLPSFEHHNRQFPSAPLTALMTGISDNPDFDQTYLHVTSSSIWCINMRHFRMQQIPDEGEPELDMEDGDVADFSSWVEAEVLNEDLIDYFAFCHLIDPKYVLEHGTTSCFGPPDPQFMPMTTDATQRFKDYLRPRLSVDPQTLIDSEGVIPHGGAANLPRPNTFAKVWSTIAPVFGYLMQNPRSKILDIGGGNGVFARAVHDFFPNATIVSCDPHDYDVPSETYFRNIHSVPFVVLKEGYDIIYLNMSLHHIMWPDGIICTALKRLVGPFGVLVVRDHSPTGDSDYTLLYNIHRVFFVNGFDDAHGSPEADYCKPQRVVCRLRQMGLILVPEVDTCHKRCYPIRGPLKAAIWRMYQRPTGDGMAEFRRHDTAYISNRLAIDLGLTKVSALALPRDMTRDDFIAAYGNSRALEFINVEGSPVARLKTFQLPRTAIDVINAIAESIYRVDKGGRFLRKFPLTDRQLFIMLMRGFNWFDPAAVFTQSNMQFALGAIDQVLPAHRANIVCHGLLADGLIEPLEPEGDPWDLPEWQWTDRARDLGVALPETSRSGNSVCHAYRSSDYRLVSDHVIENY